jgi:CBS-domain-containing membrane protein
MIPAFPMDGGRVLRALLASRMDYARATNIAAHIGQAIALIGGLFALMSMQPILILIAIFIYFAAAQESQSVQVREATSHLRVRHAMITNFRTLGEDATLQDAVDALLAGSQHDFPILNGEGDLIGMLLRSDLITGLAAHGTTHPARELVRDCPAHLEADTSLSRAMEQLQSSACPTLPVFQRPGDQHLAGILTTENVGEILLVNSALKRQHAA